MHWEHAEVIHRWVRKRVGAILLALAAVSYKTAQELGYFPKDIFLFPLLVILFVLFVLYAVVTSNYFLKGLGQFYERLGEDRRMATYGIVILCGAITGGALAAGGYRLFEMHKKHMQTASKSELSSQAIQQPEKTQQEPPLQEKSSDKLRPESQPPKANPSSPEQVSKPTFKEIKPELREPTFKEIPGPFQVVMGSNHMILSESNTRDKPVHMLQLGDYASMDGYIEKGKVYVNTVLFGDDNRQAVTLKHNEFTSPPAKWDRNFDDTALEIVDGNLVPRFQLIYKDSRTVIINGVYPHPGGLIVMTDDGMVINPTPPLRVTMRRIFKYPSRLYQGQEITPQ